MHTDLQQSDRRNAILRLLRGTAVRKQGDLVGLLRREGYAVTQSSVSRDLRDLGVLKAGGRYLPPENPSRALDDFGALRQFVRGLATAGSSLTVLRTTAGAAQSVAIAIDTLGEVFDACRDVSSVLAAAAARIGRNALRGFAFP